MWNANIDSVSNGINVWNLAYLGFSEIESDRTDRVFLQGFYGDAQQSENLFHLPD